MVRGDLEGLVVIGALLAAPRDSAPCRRRRAARSCSRVLKSCSPASRADATRAPNSRRTTPNDGVEAAVEVDGGDQRLAGVGQHRRLAPPARLLLAAAEEEPLAEAELAGDLGQAELVDDAGARLGQLALVALGRGVHQQVPDDEVEHGVAEELEPLVVGAPPARRSR